ncbi:unknown [Crocosphaera subtropica ATCC 51142]|uniref:DUF2203 domain-containing protein n=1 Tax=Crocosphaera subtropica (strain ATCC 51142 / BH68) TaxID=43989 RepID=B1X0J3_CROS5|nr:hypothetical protein [Crocosphaera subtropica]ACB51282.1 unknown [Crocosphaera subtropica ATCC 51142]
MSPLESNQSPNPDEEFETALMEVERSLLKLKERYKQVQQAQKQKLNLEERLSTLSPQEMVEVQKINEELQQLTITLESNLLTEDDVKTLLWEGIRQGLLGEVFWQIVRFGGLGIVLGWLLKTWAG